MTNAQQKLAAAGWPTTYLVVDFETYFDKEYSLDKMSHWEYIKDNRFELIGCGFYYYAHDSKKSKHFYWADELDKQFTFLKANYGDDLSGVTIVIQNCMFDCLVLKEIFGIVPKYCVDIKHLDAHIDARRPHTLAAMAERNGLQAKGDTQQFNGVHFCGMTPEQRTAMQTYCELDVTLEQQLFEILIQHFTCPEIELPTAWHTTKLYLNPEFEFDKELAIELRSEMQAYIDTACDLVGMTKKEVSGNLSFATELKAALDELGEQFPVKPHKRPGKKMEALLGRPGVGPALAKDDDGMKFLLAHTNERVRQLAEARTAVKSWNSHIKRIGNMIDIAKAADGKLPVPLMYYGAHTGRAQGRGGYNLCNLGGRGRAGQGNHPLIGRVRELLRAGKDKKIIISDSSQIENRLEAWLAKCEVLLRGYANGEDIYSAFATDIYDSLVRKPRKDDPAPVAKLLSIRRGFGKDTILGAGYGMGPTRFYNNCLQNTALRPMFDNGTYSYSFVEKLIYTYRNKYKEIPALWSKVEKMFRIVTQWPNEVYDYDGILTFYNDNGTTCIKLPSGRVLYYKHARVRKADNNIVWAHGHLWGGALVENIIQAIARDLLVWWILKLERVNIHVVHHVYDETIAIVPEADAETALETMLGVMRTAPAWAKEIPLDAEGLISDVYTK